MTEATRERVLGWVLAAVMVIHLFVLQPQPAVLLATIALLLTGGVLRGQEVHVPIWLGRVLLVLGVIAVILAQSSIRSGAVLGELAAVTGAILLLRPVSPARGQRILCCMLIMLVACILKPYPTAGRTMVIADVAALFLLMEQIYRPVEASVSFWVSVMRSLRVIVPVGIVVTGVFWFFPSLSVYTPPIMAGFSGNDTLDPGSIAELAQSRRVAVTAHFAEDQDVPSANSLYWRGRVLEMNYGLSWSVLGNRGNRPNRAPILQSTAPTSGEGRLRYTQTIESIPRGIIPVLDHGVFVEAKRAGEDVAVIEAGAGVLTAVGNDTLTLDVTSALRGLTDAPEPGTAMEDRNVPPGIRSNAAIKAIVAQIFPPGLDTAGKLRALGSYFQHGNFRYTMRPGRVRELDKFLTQQRQGFCEHYAAAAANLLRLGGVPTRVVTGYRGGTWSPWLRTITVRDEHAHAWVEAWDAQSHEWLRFDPTDYVAPDLAAGIAREMDSKHWPWYRLTWSLGLAATTKASDWVEDTYTDVTSSEAWENAPAILFMTLVAVGLIWLVRNLAARRTAATQNAADRLLADLEKNAARLQRGRKPAETPLAWLARLEATAHDPSEKAAVREFAHAYERGVYAREAETEPASALRANARLLLKSWKTRRRLGAPA